MQAREIGIHKTSALVRALEPNKYELPPVVLELRAGAALIHEYMAPSEARWLAGELVRVAQEVEERAQQAVTEAVAS